MDVTIYHNPRCSKSRATLQVLQDNRVEPTIIEYLKTPPAPSEIDNILNLLGLAPRDLMRKNEAEYKAASMDDDSLDREALIRGMNENPKLIERPIVLANGKAAIGRPPESVLDIL